jgi:hypothetical protein
MTDALETEVCIGDYVWSWTLDPKTGTYAPVKVMIDNILPQENRGVLTFVAEDTNFNMHPEDLIVAAYVPKTESINPGDKVAFCNLFGAINEGQVIGQDEDSGKYAIYVGPELAEDRQEGIYMAHKNGKEIVKLSDSKKSVIQAVKEFKE